MTTEVFESKLALPVEDTLTWAGSQMLALAKTIVITDQTMYDVTVDELRTLKSVMETRDKERRQLVDPLNAVVKLINARYKPGTEAMEEAERVMKAAMLTYDRKVKAEAEAERQRLAAIAAAEQARIEAARQAEEARLLAERQLADARVREAGSLDEAAAAATQAAVLQSAIDRVNIEASTATLATVAAAHVPNATPKSKGASTSKSYEYEVLDWDRWVAHVGQHLELSGLLMENSIKMRQHVNALGMKAAIPGILAVAEKGTVRIRK